MVDAGAQVRHLGRFRGGGGVVVGSSGDWWEEEREYVVGFFFIEPEGVRTSAPSVKVAPYEPFILAIRHHSETPSKYVHLSRRGVEGFQERPLFVHCGEVDLVSYEADGTSSKPPRLKRIAIH